MAMLLAPGAARAIAPSPCAPEEAQPAAIERIEADGRVRLRDGVQLRLAGLLWPDLMEPGSRGHLVARLIEATLGQKVTWKPAAPADRWGIIAAHLFVTEPETGLAPFWLQAGLAEAGFVPAWPEISGECWEALLAHEARAIAARRGYWAPRLQARRLARIGAEPGRHAGRAIAALWTIEAIRPWQNVHFINLRKAGRAGPSLAASSATIAALARNGLAPESLAGKRVLIRLVLPREGLRRARLESARHLSRAEKAGMPAER